jgi:hypothetical protein
MTTRESERAPRPAHEATVWIDHERAVIVNSEGGGTETVELLERQAGETESGFDARAVDTVIDDGRVIVTGPAFARTSFERAFVAITHRPDRLLEVAPQVRLATPR